MNMKSESSHIPNRERLVQFLKSEIMGPCIKGEKLDCSGIIHFENWEDALKPWIQKGTRDEIIKRETPVNRYGIGVLYPPRVRHDEIQSSDISADPEMVEEDTTADSVKMEAVGKSENIASDSDDFDLSLTNTVQPSSMGVSFLAELPENSKIIININAGRYLPGQVGIGEVNRTWFFREAVSLPGISFSSEQVKGGGSGKPFEKSYDNGLKLSIECFSRPDIYSDEKDRPERRLITVCLVNRTRRQASTASMQSELTLFQSSFTVTVQDGRILPYPEGEMAADIENDSERASFRLLYTEKRTFAVGHGCAACWDDSSGDFPETITADPLPQYEIPSITPDAVNAENQPLRISMEVLAGFKEGRSDLLKTFISEYRSWISVRTEEIQSVESSLQETAGIHMEKADICAGRMEDGLAFLMEDEMAEKAFLLANKAVLLQQAVGGQKRLFDYDIKGRRNIFNPPYEEVGLKKLPEHMGHWRAFQIAFILMSLRSSVLDCEERDEVELIWFPTGGGKTEAYLGLAAFAMFYRRLKDPSDDGVQVLMRYTLRLLTTQQFQRASRLICAMEKIRQDEGGMGNRPFSIGIWVGSANTPNKRAAAKTALKKLQTNRYAENPFILRQCPWCGAEMGKTIIKNKIHVPGYKAKGGTVVFKCPDKKCLFHKNLPIHVIDEEIYEARPSLIIGTVDKFAMLSWVPASSSIFGIDLNGARVKKPPGLIIQDELHLISGPLGTMVGLYETIIEEFCTGRENDKVFKPKIVCSTATIRRYKDQVRSLFAREKTNLFPPSGLDAGDSFFARYAVDENGMLLPGRRYMGIYAPGLPSMQTLQVRVYSALLMGSILFDGIGKRDPWWTLLVFFNSIRELGGALSLFQTDIPGALKGIAARHGFRERRFLNRVLELTSRMTNEEVPKALEELAKEYSGKGARSIDVCLASSIIEVGIDVDRLALMSIVGQPKTMAQYIQVSGRVGRKWWERPGLVTTLFSSSKPRDRSHFEKFQSAHSQMYAQVEPTSVTPFAPPVIDRALHALFAVYLRLMGSRSASDRPSDVDPALFEQLREIIEKRVKFIDENEYPSVMRKFEKRLRQFNRWERTWWEKRQEQSDSLLRRYETWVTEDMERTSWATPTSMRNVDAECQMDITTMYISDEEGEEE
ncbi:helicase-related protein [Desulfobacula phenolica]|uniref:Helicase conserved C-terminal domain-containing protein n=1 Tax=Desulfobacula phenolica TaxID=90732 RepID=A0A1H2J2E4_9BACT|nr:helicase-related protein [Desulfobacula phenolica]SDU50336.1 Helicase conserved C-terminal domain-containing protein [Desulfobacula phenolica]